MKIRADLNVEVGRIEYYEYNASIIQYKAILRRDALYTRDKFASAPSLRLHNILHNRRSLVKDPAHIILHGQMLGVA